MSRVYSDTVLPEDSGVSQDLNLGASGDNVIIPAGATLKTNKIADAGGNNIVTSDGSGDLTLNSAFSGDLVLLTTNTFTAASSSEFTSLINDTYRFYIFQMINIRCHTGDVEFGMQSSDDAGTTWGTQEGCQSYFRAVEAISGGSSAGLANYPTGTRYQNVNQMPISYSQVSDAYSSYSGYLYLYDPARAAIKTHYHIMGTYVEVGTPDVVTNVMICGWWTQVALTAMKFYSSSGTISGTIKMYGLTK